MAVGATPSQLTFSGACTVQLMPSGERFTPGQVPAKPGTVGALTAKPMKPPLQ